MSYRTLSLIIVLISVIGARSCKYGELILNDGGRVQVCMNGDWSAVCNPLRKSQDLTAKVICRELGFSPEGYKIIRLEDYTRFSYLLTYKCNGTESSLVFCDRSYSRCQRQLSIHCVLLNNETIPELLSITDMETSVLLKWALQMKDDVIEYEVECSNVNQVSHLVVNNQTFLVNMRGLHSSSNYTCCVSAVFNSHRTQSCASVRTGIVAQRASAGNANAIGGVLGFIIIMLILLLLLAVLALVYPNFIRPRVQKSRMLSRLSDFLDQRVYNNIYRTYNAEAAMPPESSDRSIDANSVSVANKIDNAPGESNTSAQTYEIPVSGKICSQRLCEPADYSIPSDCLGEADHVYAVLEEPKKLTSI